MKQEEMEKILCEYPVADYRFFSPNDLTFSDRIRTVCKQECRMYNKSYSCPEAVGTPEECKARCLKYNSGLIFSSVAPVEDSSIMELTLATKPAHEELTREIKKRAEEIYGEVYTLSADACSICDECAYPASPCRNPDKMLPCIESHTIVVTELTEKLGMEFFFGANIVTWFSMLLFNNKEL